MYRKEIDMVKLYLMSGVIKNELIRGLLEDDNVNKSKVKTK